MLPGGMPVAKLTIAHLAIDHIDVVIVVCSIDKRFEKKTMTKAKRQTALEDWKRKRVLIRSR